MKNNKVCYMNHETGEIYTDKNAAMELYRMGIQIDLYSWSNVCGEWVMRGYWGV